MWTWLPLTPNQAKEFGWDAFLDLPSSLVKEMDANDPGFIGSSEGYDRVLPDGVPSKIRYVQEGQGVDGSLRVVTEFRISSRWCLPDPTDHIKVAARRVVEHFKDHPHAIISMTDDARKILLGNQVVSSIRATRNEGVCGIAWALWAGVAGSFHFISLGERVVSSLFYVWTSASR